MRFDQLLDDYFAACLSSKKIRTQQTELQCARKLVEYFGQKSVKKITGQNVIEYREWRDVGPRTIMRELSVASAAVNWAISDLGEDLVNSFLGRLISRRERSALPTPRKRSLSLSELSRLTVAAHPTMQNVITFAAYTGMRQSEILSLMWNRVEDGVVSLRPEDQKSGVYGYRAINKTAQRVLDSLPRRSLYVFTYRGEPIRRHQLNRWWQAAVKASGIEDARFHDLRRTCGTLLLDAGASMEAVKTQLGHSDIRTTQNNYASDSIKQAIDAVLRLDTPEVQRGQL
jgi:integrase